MERMEMCMDLCRLRSIARKICRGGRIVRLFSSLVSRVVGGSDGGIGRIVLKTGYDMDAFVVVSFGQKVFRTRFVFPFTVRQSRYESC